MLCQFQVHSKVIQLYIYIYTHTQIHIYTYIHIYSFFRFFSIIGYYKILSIVPCAVQSVLVVYIFFIYQCVSINPKLLIHPSQPTFSPLVTIRLFSVSVIHTLNEKVDDVNETISFPFSFQTGNVASNWFLHFLFCFLTLTSSPAPNFLLHQSCSPVVQSVQIFISIAFQGNMHNCSFLGS